MFARTTSPIRPIATVIKSRDLEWTETTAIEDRNAARKAENARKADMARMLSQFRR